MTSVQSLASHMFGTLLAADRPDFGRWVFDFLSNHLTGRAAYAWVVGLLTVCGLGVPIPEDIILITGGFVAGTSGDSPYFMMAFGLIGIICGDSIIYGMGRQFGIPMAQRTPLRRVLTLERLKNVEQLFKRYGQLILLGARFMPGARAVAFFSAGSMKVPYWRFISLDGLAALISAPLWVFLGWFYHDKIAFLFEKAHKAQHLVLAVTLSALTVFVGYRTIVWRRRKAAEAAAARAVVATSVVSTRTVLGSASTGVAGIDGASSAESDS
jgi:membrane protein DedA with SNARE-associated domain